jgi:hypothetical protein
MLTGGICFTMQFPVATKMHYIDKYTGAPDGDPSYGWSNADHPSHTVTPVHTSTTLASVTGVRLVRSHDLAG